MEAVNDSAKLIARAVNILQDYNVVQKSEDEIASIADAIMLLQTALEKLTAKI